MYASVKPILRPYGASRRCPDARLPVLGINPSDVDIRCGISVSVRNPNILQGVIFRYFANITGIIHSYFRPRRHEVCVRWKAEIRIRLSRASVGLYGNVLVKVAADVEIVHHVAGAKEDAAGVGVDDAVGGGDAVA